MKDIKMLPKFKYQPNLYESGQAAEKFNGSFIQDVETAVSDRNKTDEL